ncbi:hypothetical protein FNV43_RR08868 [Rhamnella rubrinervis]|uniref:Leucine-rich repeat-containing N-terminal plant-type domain-containing protein n=1 Tax=Rhamnella rubrinervis TaxID=2594499 RepID=A0A8K0H900_9ROSA|nr:hypothetical protein FNV43_RR08868 [Rhamnella rubrinervis]
MLSILFFPCGNYDQIFSITAIFSVEMKTMKMKSRRNLQMTFYRNSNVLCSENEKQALLSFKQDLVDDSNRFLSWVVKESCCMGFFIPSFMDLVINLRYLNLGDSGFGGTVFYQLGNLLCLHHLDLQEDDPTPLRANPIVVQMKQHNDEVAKKFKPLSTLHAGVSNVMFTRIMTCTTPKEV